MSYYNRQLSYSDFSQVVAKEIVKRYAHTGELEYIAAFMPSYMGGIDSAVSQAMRYQRDGNGKQTYAYHRIPVTEYFLNAEEAREHFGCLRILYETLPKKK